MKKLVPKSMIEIDRTYSLKSVGDNRWIKGMQYYALYDRVISGRLIEGLHFSRIAGKKSRYVMTGAQIINLDRSAVI